MAPGPSTAHMSSNGDLVVDHSAVEALRRDFRDKLQGDYLGSLQQRLDATLSDARAISSDGKHSSDPLDALADVGMVLRNVVTLVILGKFLTGELLEEIHRRVGDAPIPFPSPSPGSTLAMDLGELAIACADAGYSPPRLASEWPDVGVEVKKHVLRFADDHVGFGPLAWEAPGYDDPSFVVAAMTSVVGGSSRSLITQTVEPVGQSIKGLHDALASWMMLLEFGIVFVRGAFYRVVVPAAIELGSRGDVSATSVPFMTFAELHTGAPSTAEIARRRQAYMTNTRYLKKGSIDPDRVDRLMRPNR